MTPLAHIMSSAARVRMLEALEGQRDGLHLRQIAMLSGAQLGSIQRAADQLVREEIVSRRRERNRLVFRLNHQHPYYELIHAVVHAAVAHQLRQRAEQLKSRARRVMQFVDSSRGLFKPVRSPRNCR